MNSFLQVANYLHANSIRLATAESCTAGLVASMLGAIDGCGDWLECGFVTYSPAAKIRVLGVNPATIERYGLSSEEVAREMAEGALKKSGANVAIANTGVAGPDDAPDGTKAGTVCFAWGLQREDGAIRIHSETKLFEGDRNAVRHAAATYAIENLRRHC
ncbi:CinA family protein [Herbaspirillum lusitanum]|uniref:CinA family protein n=1 Tax=Herbaspirillum lusitanum TaxID=213312 RepID=UPI0003741515|nr:CinA family protein [Herbaspirillum lusitanum]